MVDKILEDERLDYKLDLNLGEKSSGSNGAREKAKVTLCKELSSFAHATGGYLIFGVDPEQKTVDKQVVGIDFDQDTEERLRSVMDANIVPKLRSLDKHCIPLSNGKHVLVIRVHNDGVLHRVEQDDRFYIRRGSSSVPMTADDISEVLKGKKFNERLDDGTAELRRRLRARFPDYAIFFLGLREKMHYMWKCVKSGGGNAPHIKQGWPALQTVFENHWTKPHARSIFSRTKGPHRTLYDYWEKSGDFTRDAQFARNIRVTALRDQYKETCEEIITGWRAECDTIRDQFLRELRDSVESIRPKDADIAERLDVTFRDEIERLEAEIRRPVDEHFDFFSHGTSDTPDL